MKSIQSIKNPILLPALLVGAGLFVTIVGCGPAINEVGIPAEPTVVGEGVLTSTCWHYTYSIARGDSGDEFHVLCNGGLVVYSASATRIGVITLDAAEDEYDPLETGNPQPKDINGDGVPDLIVAESNGNSAPAYTLVSLGPTLKKRTLRGITGDLRLEDIDGNGRYEIRARDGSFSERERAFVNAAPTIILEAVGDSYVFSTRFMQKEPMEYENPLTSRAPYSEDMDRKLVDYVIDLIYRGRGDEAWKILDAYSALNAGDVRVAVDSPGDEVLMAMVGGPHWDAISRMNNWEYTQPTVGEAACPELAGRGWLKKRNGRR